MTDASGEPFQPLRGRSFHMMGIAGAGVSALAQLTSAWGADVTGCDRGDSSYLARVREAGVPVALGHDPSHVAGGVELVVSSAVPKSHPELVRARELDAPVHLRGQLLGELTRLRRTVVVAGAHGKSTTTAMLTQALVSCGLDPTMVVGGEVTALGGNTRIGNGDWMVVEGDESDRTLSALHGEIAIITNLERDHHHTFTTDDELLQLFRHWIADLGDDATLILGEGPMLDQLADEATASVIRFARDERQLAAIADVLTVPGRHNVLNAAAAVEACVLLGVQRDEAITALADFGGVGRRFDVLADAGHVLIVDDYAHHPTEVAATIAAARDHIKSSHREHGRILVVFQPHLFSRTQELWKDFAHALSAADGVVLLPIYPAREEPIAGVDSRLVGDELERVAPGTLVGLPDTGPREFDVTDIVMGIGDWGIILTMGAGDVTELGHRLADLYNNPTGTMAHAGSSAERACEPPPHWLDIEVPLRKFTTIGTGGAARHFAKVGTASELWEALAWAGERDLPTAVIGLGSNSLVADEGFDGLAIRLVDDLARIEIPDFEDGSDEVVITCGGGASLAAIVRRCRDAGVSGFEFGCAIPGTVGGAVKMNAGCYGGEVVNILVEAEIVTPAGSRRPRVDELDMTYRHTNVGAGEIVSDASFRLHRDEPDAIKARVKEMQGRRSDTQPRAARSFGSVFQNPKSADGTPVPGAGALVEQAGLKGHTIGGACISPKHGNFIENLGDATTADIVALIELARSTVAERTGVVLQTEVHLLGHNGYRPLFDHPDCQRAAH